MLTKDRSTPYKEGVLVAFPVAAATKIYAGSMVCVNAGGYAVPAADAASFKFVGVAQEMVDNSAGASGDLSVSVRTEGIFLLDATSIAQASVLADMYVVDDHTFDESNPGNGIKCGKLVKVESATLGWIWISKAFASAFTGAADALTLSDAGDYFAAALSTVATQMQALATTIPPILIPRQTGWTKDAGDHQMVGPLVELPFPCRIKEAYGFLGTVPGSTKTLLVKFGATTLLTFGAADANQENEGLNIPVPADTPLFGAAGLLLNETASGAAANLDIYLVVARDDGE